MLTCLCRLVSSQRLCRWFCKFREVSRLYELRTAIEEFDDRHQLDGTDICGLGEEEWRLIKAYMDLVAPFEIASRMLAGDTYPAAMMVVPMLEQLQSDLHTLPETKRREEVERQRRSGEREGVATWGEGGEGKMLADRMLARFNFRFPRQFKLRAPFNALCLLDPRNLDICFETHDDLEAAKNVVKGDSVYEELRQADCDDQNNHAEPVVREELTGDRRAQLLAARRARTGVLPRDDIQVSNLDQKIDNEIKKLLKNEPVDKSLNPLDWWKVNEKEFPLLAMFVKANAAMQPTSVSSERLFNKDKQLFGFTRKSLTEEHGEGFVFLHDYLNKRVVPEEFRLCTECQQPPHRDASYKITCSKHNKAP